MAKPAKKKMLLFLEDIKRQGRRPTKETLRELKANLEGLNECGIILPVQKFTLAELDALILKAPSDEEANEFLLQQVIEFDGQQKHQ